jgi:hypothetical protein
MGGTKRRGDDLFLIPGNDPPRSRLLSGKDTLAQLLEKAGRQHPIVVSTGFPRKGPQVVTGPGETVQFIETKPVPAAIQAQTLARWGGNLDGRGRIFGRLMGDGGDDRLNVALWIETCGDDNRTRPILGAFRHSLRVFMAPQETVTDD